jgi:hypothetical protein
MRCTDGIWWRLQIVGLTFAIAAAGSVAACGDPPAAPSPGPGPDNAITEMPTSLPPRSAVENAVKDRYLQHFNEPVFRPAILNDPRYANCVGAGHLSTTLFLPDPAQAGVSRLMAIYTSRDGLTTERTFNGRYLTPAGVFRVLVALQTWPETVVEADRGLWEAAQTSINDDHAAFAASRGFSGPIVRFESTNVFLPGSSVGSPRNRASVIAALTNAGIAVTGYDLLMSIHIEPSVGEGGVAFPDVFARPGFLAVGNFSFFRGPLTAANYRSIARTAYHHEVAHHWGWPGTHDWSPTCGGFQPPYQPLIAEPTLFGWEDVDGDRIPEILDRTPYGRSR